MAPRAIASAAMRSRSLEARAVSITVALCCRLGSEIAAELAAEIGDAGEEFGVDRRPLEFAGAFACDHHHLDSRRQHRAQFQPVAFAYAALEPVAYHGIPDPA